MTKKEMTCICCPIGCSLAVEKTDQGYTISGNKCPRGKKYAIEEMTEPKRIVTSTVKIKDGIYPVIPIKTSAAIAKEKIFAVMEIISEVEVNAPIKVGDVIVANVADTGVNIIATKNSNKQ